MLTKAEIKNYQSHKHSIFEFVPGVNVIIGPSDSGKSAAFRAINWAASNRPLGDGFRSDWGGDTQVILHTSDKHVIERLKSTSNNKYIIDGKGLKAFGSEVPEEISNCLGLDPANIQSQMDPPFLLADTPGEAAKRLNKAASIDDIDHATSSIKSAYNKINNDIEFNKSKLTEYQAQIKQYDILPKIEKYLQQLEKAGKEISEKQKTQEQLKQVIANIKFVKKELQKTKNIPALCEQLEKIEEKHVSFQRKKEAVEHMKRLLADITRVQRKIKSTQSELESLEKKFHELTPEVCPLCGNQFHKKEG